MSYYLFITAKVTNWEKFMVYAKKAGDHVTECGGEYIIRNSKTQMLEGEWDPEVKVVVSKWKSKEDALSFFNGDTYQKEIKPLRDGTGIFTVMLTEVP